MSLNKNWLSGNLEEKNYKYKREIGSAHTEYVVVQEEVASRNGKKLRYFCICIQVAYKNKSVEELRFEDLFGIDSNQKKSIFINDMEKKASKFQSDDNKILHSTQNKNDKNIIQDKESFNLEKQAILVKDEFMRKLGLLFKHGSSDRLFKRKYKKKEDLCCSINPYQIMWKTEQEMNECPGERLKEKKLIMTREQYFKRIYGSYNTFFRNYSKNLYRRNLQQKRLELVHNCNYSDDEISLFPSFKCLQRLNSEQLASVENFIISRPQVAIVQFLQPVDLRNVSLENICIMENRTIQLYGNNTTIPKPGMGLNVRARITLLNIIPGEKHLQKISNFKAQLQSIFQKRGRKLISYEVEKRGKLVFTVDYFAEKK